MYEKVLFNAKLALSTELKTTQESDHTNRTDKRQTGHTLEHNLRCLLNDKPYMKLLPEWVRDKPDKASGFVLIIAKSERVPRNFAI